MSSFNVILDCDYLGLRSAERLMISWFMKFCHMFGCKEKTKAWIVWWRYDFSSTILSIYLIAEIFLSNVIFASRFFASCYWPLILVNLHFNFISRCWHITVIDESLVSQWWMLLYWGSVSPNNSLVKIQGGYQECSNMFWSKLTFMVEFS